MTVRISSFFFTLIYWACRKQMKTIAKANMAVISYKACKQPFSLAKAVINFTCLWNSKILVEFTEMSRVVVEISATKSSSM